MTRGVPTFRRRTSRRRSQGFTLVEALAALVLLAIVLPAINRSILIASGMASDARHRDEAAGLAQGKLAELYQTISAGQSQGGNLSGDFGDDWLGYHWHAETFYWGDSTKGIPEDQVMQELDVTVTWISSRAGGREDSLVVSTLVYQRPLASTATTP